MPIAKFIEISNQTNSLDDLVDEFLKAIQHLGYDYFCFYTQQSLQTEPVKREHYHNAFKEKYTAAKWVDYDPVVKLCCRTRGPFTWEEVRRLPLNKTQRTIMMSRKDLGLKAGVGIPLQSADHKIVGMGIEAERENAQQDANALAQLFAVSNQYQLQRARLLGEDSSFKLPSFHLTARECEMLEWVAHGKSNGVIAEILKVSEKTVEFHLKSIFDKLEVSSRTTAALKAVQLGLISI